MTDDQMRLIERTYRVWFDDSYNHASQDFRDEMNALVTALKVAADEARRTRLAAVNDKV